MLTDPDALDMDWIIEDEVAAFSQWALNDLAALQLEGIGAIISLTEQIPQPLVGETNMRLLHLPITDMTAPTNEQIEEFVDFINDALDDEVAVGVHCMAGLGRTGTMIACFLVSRGLGPEEAIARVREARPGSVQTAAQERAVKRWSLVVSGEWGPTGRIP